MLIEEIEFEEKYGKRFQAALSEAKDFVQNPDKLKAIIAKESSKIDPLKIIAPAPDPFAYKMTLYKGFVLFPERLKNYTIAQDDPKAVTRSFLPYIMDIEPNSRCNFRCIMCQVSEWPNGNRAGDMSFENYQKFVDDNPQLIEVKLHGLGEPLMHKKYIEMVNYLADKSVWVRTTINGSLLHVRDNAKRLIDSGIGEIQTSVDGATKEVFEKIRGNSNFEKVVENLTNLNSYANTKDRLYTRMWVVVQRDNRHQIFEFVELAKKMGFRRLSFSVTLNDWGQDNWVEKNKEIEIQGISEEERLKLAEISQKEGIDITIWQQANKYSFESPDKLCPWPFQRPYISSDLKIVPCCMIGNPDIENLGDASNFETVWNSKIYQDFRQSHLEGNIPEFCRHCYKNNGKPESN